MIKLGLTKKGLNFLENYITKDNCKYGEYKKILAIDEGFIIGWNENLSDLFENALSIMEKMEIPFFLVREYGRNVVEVVDMDVFNEIPTLIENMYS